MFNSVSSQIAKTLNLDKPAYESVACLRCHSSERVDPIEARSEGVGCAGCHGSSEKWLNQHYQPAWKKLSNREKWEDFGFIPNRNLTARAMNCAKCHVGDASREVNHELYAAGHPRMTFELAGLHSTSGYRSHWVESLPKLDFEVRSWIIGQAVAVRSACVLLEARATRATEELFDGDWPDFAGNSCVSCHQSIRKERSENIGRRAKLEGINRWELNSVSVISVAANFAPKIFVKVAAPRIDSIEELRILMSRNQPDPRLVKIKSRSAIEDLDRWLAAMQSAEDSGANPTLDPELIRQLMHSINASALSPDRSAFRIGNPDFLAAHASGISAMNRASPDPKMQINISSMIENLPVAHSKNGRLVNWTPAGKHSQMNEQLIRFQTLFEFTHRSGDVK